MKHEKIKKMGPEHSDTSDVDRVPDDPAHQQQNGCANVILYYYKHHLACKTSN